MSRIPLSRSSISRFQALLIVAVIAVCAAGSSRAASDSTTGSAASRSTASAAASASGIVAAYSFDAGTGSTVPDASGKANTGTISGATWATAGKSGGALSFDGINDWVTVPDSASLDVTRMTVEAWVKPSALGSAWRTVAFKEAAGGIAYSLYANQSSGIPVGQVSIGGEQSATAAAVPLNTWTHLAATYDGATLRLYRNGVLAGTRAISGTIPVTSGPLRLGGNAVWPEWFAGQIDELRVYNRALSAAELQTDMTSPIGGPAPDTQAPTAPGTLAASGQTQTSINSTWNASSDNVGVTGYGYYKAGTYMGNGPGTAYAFTALACGSSYSLAVDAYDAAGNRSARSTISASTMACAVADSTPPSVPQGLQATSSSQTSVSIAWTASSDNVGVASYRLYRNDSLAGSTASLSYAFSGLSCGTTYALGVEAVDAAGNASYRAEAVLTAATTACSGSPPPPPPPGVSGLANVWVDVNGGSCTRQASAGAYVDASACGSFDAAYDRAAPGDVIEILGGSYSGQVLNTDKGSTTPVLLRTSSGQTVIINGYLDIAADYVSVKGPMTISQGIDIDDSNQSNPINGVQIDGIKAISAYIENTYDLTIKNSELGPNPGKIITQIGGYPETHRLTFDNVYMHDNPPTVSDQHMECIFSTGVQGLTVRNSRFERCGYFSILNGMCCGATTEPSAFVFENNYFGKNKCYPNAGGCPSNADAPYTLNLTRPVSGQSRMINNYFETPPALQGSFQNLTAYGNTGAAPASWR